MTKDRLAAFSDGVLAVIITIMVLEMRVPRGSDFHALHATIPVFLAYVLSYVNIGTYWNNHHHMLYAARRIDGRVMWSNLMLLFWLSLIPFTTSWVGANHLAAAPTATFGAVLLFAGFSYAILERALIACNGKDSLLLHAVGNDLKGRASLAIYASGVAVSFVNTWIADALYVAVAVMWLIPDPRIEKLARRVE